MAFCKIIDDSYQKILYYQDDTCKVHHREDGPAIIYANGHQCWYFNGQRHRLDGPACYNIYNQNNSWWYHGQQIDCKTLKEFQQLIKLLAFL